MDHGQQEIEILLGNKLFELKAKAKDSRKTSYIR